MSGPSTRIAVTVTFLKQDVPPILTGPQLPADVYMMRVRRCSVAFYRYLYDTVGAPYVWWLRRTLSDGEIGEILAQPGLSIHVLYRDGEPAGFYEIDERSNNTVNLAYFGLMPHAIGKGLGPAFLRSSIDEAWSRNPSAVTVNTCTADHPRALPNYLAAGFHITRSVREVWDVPNRLGLSIPTHLRV